MNTALYRALAGEASELAWAQVPGGRVLAPLGDFVGRAAFYAGDLDPKISRLCRRLVRPGDTVLDIGANVGTVTVLLSSLAGKSGRVHSFEPNPRLCALLKRVIAETDLSNVTLHEYALGAQEGRMPLSVPARNWGSGSLVRRASDGARFEVPVRTLSSVLNENKVGRVRLVKIDVEGYEAQVLAGARDWFKAHPPDAILFELNDTQVPSPAHPTIAALREHGYVFYSIPKALLRLRLRRFVPGESGSVRSNDYLAARRPSVVEAIT